MSKANNNKFINEKYIEEVADGGKTQFIIENYDSNVR